MILKSQEVLGSLLVLGESPEGVGGNLLAPHLLNGGAEFGHAPCVLLREAIFHPIPHILYWVEVGRIPGPVNNGREEEDATG